MAKRDTGSEVITESEAFGIVNVKKGSLSASEIQDAVSDPQWQAFKRTLKGLSTLSKLLELRRWYWHINVPAKRSQRVYYVQVINYVNALKRGGLIAKDPR